jgi:hypothetical protein
MHSTISALADLHREDMVREAERQRLVKIARDTRSHSSDGQVEGASFFGRLRSVVSRLSPSATGTSDVSTAV